MIKNSQIPKRKRLTKQTRLNLAKSWVKKYEGKNIVSGYAKWFGVDKICAINELKTIGILIPHDLEKQILESNKSRIEQRRKNKEKVKILDSLHIESDDNFAYIVGYTSGEFPYGLTHDEFEIEVNDNK